MTNEAVSQQFDIVWNGKPEAYLCVQRDDDVIRREAPRNIFAEKPRIVYGRKRTLVLQAVDGTWRGRHEIASRCGLEVSADEVSGVLHYLVQRKLIRRSRTSTSPWMYKRVTPEAGQ